MIETEVEPAERVARHDRVGERAGDLRVRTVQDDRQDVRGKWRIGSERVRVEPVRVMALLPVTDTWS